MTITEFLEARIAEDEALAEKASFSMHGQRHAEAWDYAGYVLGSERDATEAQDRFITEWWPSRVLAECAAKRALLTLFRSGVKFEVASGGARGWVSPLALMAIPYRDHPDYQQEWAK